MPLNKSEIVAFLQQGSPLFQQQPQFKERLEQLKMVETIIDTLDQKTFAFIEAGTGIGKSIAYLLPILLQAAHAQKRAVISTHTITLQEQLLNKDIPFLTRALQLDLKVALIKGMGNYLCLRKLYDQLDQSLVISSKGQEELLKIEESLDSMQEGSRSDLPQPLKATSWDQINCESNACSFVKCPHYKSCFFFNARKKCQQAQVLISNHHLLMADLMVQKEEGQNGALGQIDHLVIDEAHTLEDIATNALAKTLSSQFILKKLSDLIAERSTKGLLQRLQKVMRLKLDSTENLWSSKIETELFEGQRLLLSKVIDAFALLFNFLEQNFKSSNRYEKITLDSTLRANPDFIAMIPSFENLSKQLQDMSTHLAITSGKLEEISDQAVKKSLQNLLIDLRGIANTFEKSSHIIDSFFHPEDHHNQIYVIEWNPHKSIASARLLIISLNVAAVLSDWLFEPLESGILCSATLTHSQQFNFIKQQLGFEKTALTNRGLIETILPSPFQYDKQVILAVASDMPTPHTPDYQYLACENIKKATLSSQGGAFVLFTSYQMLSKCYDLLEQDLLDAGLYPLRQGDENRSTLLNLFKENENAVLFGTDTFWEGIDVPGFHLRLVILTKLPFPVPSEPIVKAKCKLVEEKGQNPFMHYSLPKAIVKFKQGFGRLIRTCEDYGAILCLDSRLITKAYGKMFINSLPKCMQVFESSDKVQKSIQKFYEKRWSVTESNR